MNTQTPDPAQIETVLATRNWTGLTLAQLLDAGRVYPDKRTMREWTAQALGAPSTLEELKTQHAIADAIATA